MNIEQDYIMRIIHEIIRTLIKLLFNIDMDAPTAQLIEDAAIRETVNGLMLKADNGDINEAENELSDLTDNMEKESLLAGIVFYSHLNDKDEIFLHEHDFSREEIKDGLNRLLSKYGFDSMSEMFLED